MEKVDVSSIEIRDFAQSLGWTLVKEALVDGLFVLNSPDTNNTQLIFPKETTSSEFNELAFTSIKRVSEYYKKSISQIIEDIREVNDDVISLRYYSESKNVNSISFEEAYETISATRQMILSAASTVVNPKTFHPKLNRTEPQELIKKTRFRHTKEGSFIIKVSIPFEPINFIPTLLEENPQSSNNNMPIGRRAVEVISLSSQKILDAVDSNLIAELFNEQSESTSPIISYNFCDSLIKVFDDERELPFELIFNWSRASIKDTPIPKVPSRVAFPFNYKRKLEELKGYFSPPNKEVVDTFYATVESLNGDIGSDGGRSGEVVFAIFVENEVARARANLNSSQYKIAIRAHESGNAYVMIKGQFNKQARNGVIENITEFKLADH